MHDIIWKWLDKGLIPDFLIRQGIRKLLKERLQESWQGGVEIQRKNHYDLIQMLKESKVAQATADANEQHYEVPPEFYRLALGKNLKYSCALYPSGKESLDEAEDLMLGMTMERAKLTDGLHILELGCGWGSLTLAMAKRFPNAKITAVSNSNNQRLYINEQARMRGFTNVQVITQDINFLELDKQFDRIVSVEMFEHVRNYQQLFAKCAGWLKDDALMFVHIFAHRELAYPFEVRDKTDWMSEYFFTGGMMPSEDLFLHFQDDLKVIHNWRVNGRHYAQTSEDWLKNTDSNRDKIITIFQNSYNETLEQAKVRFERWRIFFMSCAELWAYEKGEQWIVAHYLFQKRT